VKDICKKILGLKLPKNSFIVMGSGTLAALNLRKANDIDLLVTPAVYDQLKAAGWNEHTYASTLDHGLAHGDFEVVASWHGTKLEDLIDSALWFEGIAFAHLDDVVKWKSALAREKDIHDLRLIRTYLSEAKT
jgi:hypothetical protein